MPPQDYAKSNYSRLHHYSSAYTCLRSYSTGLKMVD